jgi:hypothetical protein
MSLKFLSSNVFAFHRPGIHGQLPHHIPTFFDGCVTQIVLFALIGKRRFTDDFAVVIGHNLILAFCAASVTTDHTDITDSPSVASVKSVVQINPPIVRNPIGSRQANGSPYCVPMALPQ